MEAAAAELAPKRPGRFELWGLGIATLCLAGVCFALAYALNLYAGSPDQLGKIAGLPEDEKALVVRGYAVYFVWHPAALGSVLLIYALTVIASARGMFGAAYADVPLRHRLGWDANGWMWLLLIAAVSDLAVTRDWFIQLAQVVVMLCVASLCFVRGTRAISQNNVREWEITLAACLVAWVITNWVSLGFSAQSAADVRQAFADAHENFPVNPESLSIAALLGTLQWLILAAVYVLEAAPGGALGFYFADALGRPRAVSRFGAWARSRGRDWEPWLLLLAVIAALAANLWTLIPVWLLLLVPAMGVRAALCASTGRTEADNTQRRDELVERTRWPIVLLAGVAAIVVAGWAIGLIPRVGQGSQAAPDVLAANAPAALTLALVAFVVIAAHEVYLVLWPYHAGQQRWKQEEAKLRRAELAAVEGDLARISSVSSTQIDLSQAAATYVEFLRWQGRYAVAQARMAQLREIPLWPIKSIGDLIAAVTRSSVISAVLSQIAAFAAGGHTASAAEGSSSASLVPELLKALAEVIGKAGGG